MKKADAQRARVVAQLVGQRIRELRLDAEMRSGELAQRAGMHRPIFARIERGKHVIDLRTAARIAAALGLDVATLLVCVDEDWIEAGQRARAELGLQEAA